MILCCFNLVVFPFDDDGAMEADTCESKGKKFLQLHSAQMLWCLSVKRHMTCSWEEGSNEQINLKHVYTNTVGISIDQYLLMRSILW